MFVTSCSHPPKFESNCPYAQRTAILETHRHNPVPHGKRPLFGGGASGHHGGSIHSILQTDAAVCGPQGGHRCPQLTPPGRMAPGCPASSLGDTLTKRLSIPAPTQARPPRRSVTWALGRDSDKQDPGPRGPTSGEHMGCIQAASAPQPWAGSAPENTRRGPLPPEASAHVRGRYLSVRSG